MIKLFKKVFVIIVITVFFTSCGNTENNTVNSPNIIFILADDMGYGDAGCYGDTNLVPTPNIDRLANEGVRFTDGYVTAPLCAPSRYGLLTGVYQQKFGVRWNVDAALDLSQYGIVETAENTRIRKPIEIISEPLERAGYSTVMIGKWNLMGYPKTTFDESFSVMHFVGDYFQDENGNYKGVDGVPIDHAKSRPLWATEDEGGEYLTDRIGRQAVEYIDRNKDNPFFMYVAFNAPHTPLQAKTSLKKQVAYLPTEAQKLYGAMLISMDENIGKILNSLDKNGLTENTIVAFLSDNGATFAYPINWPADWKKEMLGSNGILRGHKTQMYEGGIRIPFIIRYPKVLKAGQVYTETVSALDLYPTFCDVAGAVPKHKDELDGINLIPYLQGEQIGRPHDILYWYGPNKGAVIQGDYKYFDYKGQGELYNLADDISESNDLRDTLLGIKQDLKEKYQAFIDNLPPPLNPNRYDRFVPDKR